VDICAFSELPAHEALLYAAHQIDSLSESMPKYDATACFAFLKNLDERKEVSLARRALIHYFRANIYAMKRYKTAKLDAECWDDPELGSEILELRKSIIHPGFNALEPYRKAQIFTNLANLLNAIGRSLEAIEFWDRALNTFPNFAIALADKGLALDFYASWLNEEYKPYYLLNAYNCLYKACLYAPLQTQETLSKQKEFEFHKKRISEKIDIKKATDCLDFKCDLEGSRKEVDYRKWVLKNRLFLNLLNELGEYSVGAWDSIHLPDLVVNTLNSDNSPPAIIGFYNQLKQEYISARWLYYESLTLKNMHFSDKKVYLCDMAPQQPVYALQNEILKASFRMLYSLFDKIAYFLNHYFNFGIANNKVSFRNIWYQESKKKSEETLSPVLKNRKNWSLHGLYWLSKDFYTEGFKSILEPDAKQLAELRNSMEHKYCQVCANAETASEGSCSYERGEDFGIFIEASLFKQKTLNILRKARASLIYLSLAVRREEHCRRYCKAKIFGSSL